MNIRRAGRVRVNQSGLHVFHRPLGGLLQVLQKFDPLFHRPLGGLLQVLQKFDPLFHRLLGGLLQVLSKIGGGCIARGRACFTKILHRVMARL